MSSAGLLRFSPAVKQALQLHRPVVALESTIISHGMPYPQNVETARAVEQIIRDNGAEPATLAIMDGHVQVGLSHDQLERLGKDGRRDAIKTSRRDLANILALSSGCRGNDEITRNIMGATTVSGTMVLAHQAGIRVFVTGGIGGVHRHGQDTMDVSADLTELGRTPVAVVCAGVKSILDIGRTLEYLETQGVPVATVSPANQPQFPAFYVPTSAYKSSIHLQTASQCAQIIHQQFDRLNLSTGIVFATPIPSQHSHDSRLIQSAIDQALSESVVKGISGREATPFLLKRVAELTSGASLRANIELVKNNAALGAQIACEYAGIHAAASAKQSVFISAGGKYVDNCSNIGPALFVGGAAVDLICKLQPSPMRSNNCGGESGNNSSNSNNINNNDNNIDQNWDQLLHTSTPAKLTRTLGGVARNAAEACSYALSSSAVRLVSPVARDEFGAELIKGCQQRGMETLGMVAIDGDATTPVYNALLDGSGRLIAAGAAMDLLVNYAGGEQVSSKVDEILAAPVVPSIAVIDANLSVRVTKRIIESATAAQYDVPVLFEPTSVPKAQRHFAQQHIQPLLSYISPNVEELIEMARCLPLTTVPSSLDSTAMDWRELPLIHTTFDGCVRDARPVHEHDDLFSSHAAKEWMPALLRLTSRVPNVILKLGSRGLLLCQSLNTCDLFAEAEMNSAESYPSAGDRLESHSMIFNNPAMWQWYRPGIDPPTDKSPVCLRWFTPRPGLKIVNVTGAGDSLVGTAVAGMTRALMAFDKALSSDRSAAQSGVVLPEVWRKISPKTRHLLLFNNQTLPWRDQMINQIFLGAREAAELTLQTNEAVNPAIRGLYDQKDLTRPFLFSN